VFLEKKDAVSVQSTYY